MAKWIMSEIRRVGHVSPYAFVEQVVRLLYMLHIHHWRSFRLIIRHVFQAQKVSSASPTRLLVPQMELRRVSWRSFTTVLGEPYAAETFQIVLTRFGPAACRISFQVANAVSRSWRDGRQPAVLAMVHWMTLWYAYESAVSLWPSDIISKCGGICPLLGWS